MQKTYKAIISCYVAYFTNFSCLQIAINITTHVYSTAVAILYSASRKLFNDNCQNKVQKPTSQIARKTSRRDVEAPEILESLGSFKSRPACRKLQRLVSVSAQKVSCISLLFGNGKGKEWELTGLEWEGMGMQKAIPGHLYYVPTAG